MVKLTVKEILGMLAVFAGIYTFCPIENAETIFARFMVFIGVCCISFGTVGTVEIFGEIVEEWRRRR